ILRCACLVDDRSRRFRLGLKLRYQFGLVLDGIVFCLAQRSTQVFKAKSGAMLRFLGSKHVSTRSPPGRGKAFQGAVHVLVSERLLQAFFKRLILACWIRHFFTHDLLKRGNLMVVSHGLASSSSATRMTHNVFGPCTPIVSVR